MQVRFIDNIKNIFEKHPEKPALWINDNTYTYKQLSDRVYEILQYILNLNSKELIGIVTNDTLDTYATFIATWFAGVGFVPLSPSYPKERMVNILQQAEIQHLFITKVNGASDFNEVEVIETSQITESAKKPECIGPVKKHSIACMLFTSGSTGLPKGVPMTFENIEATLDAYSALGYGPYIDDRCLQMFEYTFDMSLLSYLPAFLNGACVYSIVDDKYRFMTAFKIIKEHKLTHTVFVPSTLAFMQRYFPNFHFPDMKNCMVGGEPFSVSLAQQWQTCVPKCRLVNISGPTETTMACMGYEVGQQPKHLKGILAFGKPWKNTKAIVINEDADILPPNEKGELCFAGDNLMHGYWKNPEKNTEVFFQKEIEGKEYCFYKTGDGAYIDEEGDFFTTGRIDFQVKIQGYRVEPGEIEALVQEHCGPCMSVAVPYLKHQGFNAIHIFIDQKAQDIESLMDFLNMKLPAYMVPEGISQLTVMPLNNNGKIDRALLKQKLENGKG